MKEKLLSSIKLTVIWMIIGSVLGWYVPFPGEWFGIHIDAKRFVVWSLMLIMFFQFLKMDFKTIIGHFSKPKEMTYAFLAILFGMHVIIPFFLYLLASSLGIDHKHFYGIILAALSPAMVTAPYFAEKIQGNPERAFVMTIVSYATSMLAMIAVFWRYGSDNLLNIAGDFSATIFWLIVVPLFFSLLVKLPGYLRNTVATDTRKNGIWRRTIGFLQQLVFNFCFLVFMWAIVYSTKISITDSSGFGYILFVAFMLEIGVFLLIKPLLNTDFVRSIAAKLGLNLTDEGFSSSIAVVFSLRNAALTGGIALGISPELAMPSTAVLLIHIPALIGIELLGYSIKRKAES